MEPNALALHLYQLGLFPPNYPVPAIPTNVVIGRGWLLIEEVYDQCAYEQWSFVRRQAYADKHSPVVYYYADI